MRHAGARCEDPVPHATKVVAAAHGACGHREGGKNNNLTFKRLGVEVAVGVCAVDAMLLAQGEESPMVQKK